MTASPGNEAILLISDSERDADMLYAAGLFVPDPFTFLQVNDRTTIMMSDLEIDRARTQSKVDEVVSLTDYSDRAKANGNAEPGLIDAVSELLRERMYRASAYRTASPWATPTGFGSEDSRWCRKRIHSGTSDRLRPTTRWPPSRRCPAIRKTPCAWPSEFSRRPPSKMRFCTVRRER